ncbi:pregnancy-specific beta-1-glycoprotein 8-like isoform 2-T2 [Polymixia lowei]
MDVFFRYVCVAVFLVVGLNNVLAQEVVYAELGGKLELRAETVSKPITGILWKIGNDFVAELLEGSEPDYYRSFRDRTTLTTEKATLVVSSLTENDAGVYSVEINSQVQSKTYMVKVIKAVPKPKVEAKTLDCSKKESCDLVCEGDTTRAEPVTYSWKTDDGAWKESRKILTINKTEDNTAKHFSCQMKNPVSFKESERFDNPFPPPQAVPMPKVEAKPLDCSKKESCDLVCEGNTTGAEPVTYSWKIDDGAWKKSGKILTINKTKDNTAKHFSCQMENPVGFKESERFDNPFWSPQAVPMPKVEAKTLDCSKKESCDLVCEGDTTRAEPVTYSWKTDDGAWKESGKILTITKTNDDTTKHFSCQMKNPVSFKESEPFANPFPPPSSTVGIIIGSLFGVLGLVGGVAVWKRKEICGLFGRNDTDGNPGNGQVADKPENVPLMDGEKERQTRF